MALATDYNFASHALPTPTNTPYRTPSRGMSRRSSRHGSSSPTMSSSPPPLPLVGEDSYFYGKPETNLGQEENIPILDPRRFTPTLHASLVSEILSLRREVESKSKSIVSLEEILQHAEEEKSSLNKTNIINSRENQSMKRQIQLLENGTLTALEGLVRERDESSESLADVRRRLDVSQKRIRSLEEDANRANSNWNQEKKQWHCDRRILDYKIHIAEGRLKTILAEVAASQANGQNGSISSHDETLNDYGTQIFSKRRDSQTIRSESSMSSTTRDGNESRNGRVSNLSGKYRPESSKIAGISLAEELEFDDDDDEPGMEESDLDVDYVTREELPGALGEPRPFSAQSHLQSSKARKLLGLSVEDEERSLDEEIPEVTKHNGFSRLNDDSRKEPLTNSQFVDTATQFSPPPSPRQKAKQVHIDAAVQVVWEPESAYRATNHAGSSTSKEHDTVEQMLPDEPEKLSTMMISHACQTIDQLPSPPHTPKISKARPPTMNDTIGSIEMKTNSTQTSEEDLLNSMISARDQGGPTSSMEVPIIAIHPPIVGSSSDRHSVVLPPHTKNAICQVSIASPISLRSVSVQTEEIRVDQRSIRLPPHLLPSAVSSKPPSPLPKVPERQVSSLRDKSLGILPPPVSPQLPFAEDTTLKKEKSTGTANNGYPCNNDDGLLKEGTGSTLKRPIRSGSLFAGFDDDDIKDIEAGGIGETDYSDDDFGNAEPIRKTLSKVQNSWKLVAQSTDSVLDRLESEKQDIHIPELDCSVSKDHDHLSTTVKTTTKRIGHPTHVVNASKQSNIRRTALVSNGIAAHSKRMKSIDATKRSGIIANTPAPPFPVPTRNSSRRIPLSSSDGARSPTPQPTAFFNGSRIRDQGGQPVSKPALRKVRSDFAGPKPSHGLRHKSRSRSPPPISPSSSILGSPQLPPLPKNKLTSKYSRGVQSSYHRRRSSFAPSQVDCTSVETAVQQTSVVDAIAQTMIGEWMWKYVRRRKTFGIPESPQVEFEIGRNGGDGSRHQRWVWLAPYDRAVMWSTKQPTSESALMGKSGRKLVIQSVLDVKDNTPMPKNAIHHAPFDRSILILTPERALKFTAATRERHYVWLAALSFLSSNTSVNELAALPRAPSQEYQPSHYQKPTASLRRNPIRDSIRVAKGKARPVLNNGNGRAYSSPNIGIHKESSSVTNPSFEEVEEEVEEAAEPPHVPRTLSHTRKRSNTGPRAVAVPPSTSFRSLSSSGPSRDSYSIGMAVSKFSLDYDGMGFESVGSQRGGGNFFDAVGTVRMEAFVDRGRGQAGTRGHAYENDVFTVAAASGSSEPHLTAAITESEKPARSSYRTKQGRKKDLSYWGVNGGSKANDSNAAGSEAPGEDLFGNF